MDFFAVHFSLPILFVIAFFYGVTMKLADLFDEHGLRWFQGDGLVFGLLWGFFGSYLVVTDPILANALLAQMLGYLVRLRLDFRNHAIAAMMLIVTFMLTQSLLPTTFAFFFVGLTSLGLIRDHYGHHQKPAWLYRLNEPAWYYILVPAAYGFVTGVWLPLAVFTVYRAAYNLVKYGLYWRGSYRQL